MRTCVLKLIALVILMMSNLFGATDTLSTRYKILYPVNPDSLEVISKKFIKTKLSDHLCYEISAGKYFKSILVVVNYSVPVEFIKLIVNYDSSFNYNPVHSINKKHNEFYYTSVELVTEQDYLLDSLNIIIDSTKKTVYYKWNNPSGINEPVLSKNNLIISGEKFPALLLKTDKGNLVDLTTNKIKVINWWATNCLPCREEIPGLSILAEKYKSENIDFIAVIYDNENLEEFLKLNNFSYKHYSGDKNAEIIFGNRYPRNIILDENNLIRYDRKGGSKDTYKELEKEIIKLLNQ